jgi:hypothetical protein
MRHHAAPVCGIKSAPPHTPPKVRRKPPQINLADEEVPPAKKRAGSAPPANRGVMDSFVSRPVSSAEQGAADSALVRMMACSATPLRLVLSRPFLDFVNVLRPGFKVPDRRQLDVQIDLQHAVARADMLLRIQKEPYGSTVTFDAWSSQVMQSVMAANIILGSSREAMLFSSEDLSNVSHTGEFLAEHFKATILEIETDEEGCRSYKVLMICSDEAAAMKKGRRLTVAAPGFQHIVEAR